MIPIKDNIPTDRFPVITVLLILANIVAYLLVVGHGGSLISGPDAHEMSRYGLIADAPTVKTVFTSMFLNGSIAQLIGSLLFLWLFGNNVEDSMGPVRFLGFYIAGGLVATALQLGLDPDSIVPTVGAAGAVAAVIGGYVMLYPRARVLTLVLLPFCFTTLRMPAMLLLLLWFAVQLISDLAVPDGGASIAFRAHIGGFLIGMLLVPLLKRRGVALFAH